MDRFMSILQRDLDEARTHNKNLVKAVEELRYKMNMLSFLLEEVMDVLDSHEVRVATEEVSGRDNVVYIGPEDSA